MVYLQQVYDFMESSMMTMAGLYHGDKWIITNDDPDQYTYGFIQVTSGVRQSMRCGCFCCLSHAFGEKLACISVGAMGSPTGGSVRNVQASAKIVVTISRYMY